MTKDEKITRIAIAKSCIEAGKKIPDAEAWLAWVEAPDRVVAVPGAVKDIKPGTVTAVNGQAW